MCKVSRSLLFFQWKRKLCKEKIYSTFSTYYCARNRSFSGYIAFLDGSVFFLSLFSSLLFSCLRHRSALSLFSGSLLYSIRETMRCTPVAVRVQRTVKTRSERSDTGTFEKERERERELVRRKDNRTIKSQIRGHLVLGRVSRGCRRNSREMYAEKSML